MLNYTTFLRKEFTENMRTKRLLVLGCVFLMFGITGALLARYMGEFLAFVLPAGDEMGQAMIDAMGNPHWADSYMQFYSQLSQIGVFSILFMYMGTVQREINSGTASLMFSKGLGFASFILAKFTMGAIIVTLVTVVSAIVTYVYTFLLFDEAGQLGHILAGSLAFSLGAVMLLAVFILCSSLTKNSAASGGLGVVGFFLFVLTGFHRFSPYNLLGHAIAISGGYFTDTLLVNTLMAVAVAALALIAAIWRLKRSEG